MSAEFLALRSEEILLVTVVEVIVGGKEDWVFLWSTATMRLMGA